MHSASMFLWKWFVSHLSTLPLHPSTTPIILLLHHSTTPLALPIPPHSGASPCFFPQEFSFILPAVTDNSNGTYSVFGFVGNTNTRKKWDLWVHECMCVCAHICSVWKVHISLLLINREMLDNCGVSLSQQQNSKRLVSWSSYTGLDYIGPHSNHELSCCGEWALFKSVDSQLSWNLCAHLKFMVSGQSKQVSKHL